MFTPQNFAIVTVSSVVVYLLYMLYKAIGLYQLNPFIKLKPLAIWEEEVLAKNFPMYIRFPNKYREKCNQRISWMRSRKKFIFYGDTPRQEELKLVLSGALVFMTLGFRNYRMRRSLLRVIIYPSKYYSRIKRRHHLGEYNPHFKTIIFSADTIWEGFAVSDDNINLAIHEFAHALSFEMHSKSSWEARRFRVGIRQIKKQFEEQDFRTKLTTSGYFREYGLTNLHEFFSVAVENYFETPSVFHRDFPNLFNILQQMLNFDYEISCVFNPVKH